MRSHVLLATATTSAAAVALPQAYPPPSYNTTSPLSDSEFSLTMTIPYSNMTRAALVATKNDTSEEPILVGQRLSAYSGTPAYVNNTQPANPTAIADYASLNMDINGALYGLTAPSIGDLRGAAQVVHAVKDQQSDEWTVSDTGIVNHKLAAANNNFLACKMPINGEEVYVLAWGSMLLNGSFPFGCGFTSVFAVCNVPGSQSPLCKNPV